LRTPLTDWESEKHSITAVLPSRERGSAPKIRACIDHFVVALRDNGAAS
jgi:hypothetical protein